MSLSLRAMPEAWSTISLSTLFKYLRPTNSSTFSSPPCSWYSAQSPGHSCVYRPCVPLFFFFQHSFHTPSFYFLTGPHEHSFATHPWLPQTESNFITIHHALLSPSHHRQYVYSPTSSHFQSLQLPILAALTTSIPTRIVRRSVCHITRSVSGGAGFRA